MSLTARALLLAHRTLDRAATVPLVVAEWCERTAWHLDPDPHFKNVTESITWLEERHGWPLVPRPEPLDPDGYRPDGTHPAEDNL